MEDSGGVISVVAKKLGASRRTIEKYIAEDPEYKTSIEQAREAFKDVAINKLQQLVLSGNLTAIIFYLKTQAKDRGFVEKQEVHTSSDKPFVMTPEQAASVYRNNGGNNNGEGGSTENEDD